MTRCLSAIRGLLSTTAPCPSRATLARDGSGSISRRRSSARCGSSMMRQCRRWGATGGGRCLFLGFGTGLGAALVVEGVVVPMELGKLAYRKRTYEEYLGRRGLERLGKRKWRKHVANVVARLVPILHLDDVVLGGGNSKKLKTTPEGCRAGDNAHAFVGGFRMWDGVQNHARGAARPVRLDAGHQRGATLSWRAPRGQEAMNAGGWRVLATYASGFEADLAMAQLETAGIPAIRDNNDTVGIFGPGFQGATARGVTIRVPTAALEDARAAVTLVDGVG